MKLIRRIFAARQARRDAQLRERCVGYANGSICTAITLFRYIKDGTTVHYDAKTDKTIVSPTYP